MLIKLLLAFILIPLVELFLLVWIADQTSLLATVALVIVTGVIGSILARRQGLQAWQRFRGATAEGRLPGREIQDGLMIAFAAALLLTPGILTDIAGFLLLTPAVRNVLRQAVFRKLTGKLQAHVARGPMGAARAAASGEVERGRAAPRQTGSDTIDAVNVRPVSQR